MGRLAGLIALVLVLPALSACGPLPERGGAPDVPGAPHILKTTCSVTLGETTVDAHAPLEVTGVASVIEGDPFPDFPFDIHSESPHIDVTTIAPGVVGAAVTITCWVLGAAHRGWHLECVMTLDGNVIDRDAHLFLADTADAEDDAVACEYSAMPVR